MQDRTIPLTILTGFLGSGKTTLLKLALEDPDFGDTAILINEFGEIGLDHLLIETVEDDVVILQSGCVCCSIRDDLAGALRSLLDRKAAGVPPDFSRIVIETTGIADPGPIVQLISSVATGRGAIRLARILAVVDSVSGSQILKDEQEAACQVASADQIYLSKSDIADDVQIEKALASVRRINCDAPVANGRRTASSTAELLFPSRVVIDLPHRKDAPLLTSMRETENSLHGHHSHSNFSTFQIRWSEPIRRESLEEWLGDLLLARGEEIFRLKGLVQLAGEDRPMVLQCVQRSVYPLAPLQRKWSCGVAASDLTFITRNFSQAAALESLRPYFSNSRFSA